MATDLTKEYERIEKERQDARRRDLYAKITKCGEELFALTQEYGTNIEIKATVAPHKCLRIELDKREC